jgi:hypothetical protein
LADLAFEINDFRQGVELNVQVPTALDQLGRNNSHRTIVGRKSLV